MIDLDHSKRTEDQVQVKKHNIEGLHLLEQLITSEFNVDADVAQMAIRAVGRRLASIYVNDVLESYRDLLPARHQGKNYGIRDLDWSYDVCDQSHRTQYYLELRFFFLDEPKPTHVSEPYTPKLTKDCAWPSHNSLITRPYIDLQGTRMFIRRPVTSTEVAKGTFHSSYRRLAMDPLEYFVWEEDSDIDPYKQYQDHHPSNTSLFHDAIHDIESLFWVIVYLALIRKGPGEDAVRDELIQVGTPVTNLVIGLFHANGLFERKADVIFMSMQLEREILPHFHPFFEPLKPMVLAIRRKLALGYRFRAYEYHNIVEYILAILNKTLDDFTKHPPNAGEANKEQAAKELNRRQHYIQNRFAPFKRTTPNPPVARLNPPQMSLKDSMRKRPLDGGEGSSAKRTKQK